MPRSTPQLGLPPTGPLLILSPHWDDAAFSCAALLSRAEPVDVLTVFGGAPDPPRQGDWDRRCGFEDSDASVRARLAKPLLPVGDRPILEHIVNGLARRGCARSTCA